MRQIICPISTEKIDNNVSRLTVFLNVLLMGIFIVTDNPIYLMLATMDTMIRAVLHTRYSPFKIISSFIIRLSGIQKKPISLAKKVFASRLGIICGLISLGFYYLDMPLVSLSIAAFWMSLSILDSVVNFCLGCIIYSYLVYPFYNRK